MNIYLDIVGGIFIYDMNMHAQAHTLEHGMYFVGPYHIFGLYRKS